MGRTAVRIPSDLKYKQVHAVVNHNDRQNKSIGQKTLGILLEHGVMYVEDYVDICESQNISPAQAIKELRVDLGFQRVALEGFPEFIDPFMEETEEISENGENSPINMKNLPKNVAELERQLKDERATIKAKDQYLDLQNQIVAREKKLLEDQKSELDQQVKVNNELFEQANKLLEQAKIGLEEAKTLSDPKKHNGIIHPPEWGKLLKLAKLRENIMLTGPTGCGKTHVCKVLAQELDLQFGFISCTAGISESEFRGRIVPNIADGSFTYVPSIFVKLYEEGGILLLDEADAADGNTLIFINTALANDQMYIDIRDRAPLIKRHKDFICIAACNTLGHGADDEYSERNRLDLASLDRFRSGIIEMNYSVDVERHLVNKHVLDWGIKIRELISMHGYQHAMSTRVLMNYSRQADEYNWGRREWEKSYFADWSEDERRVAIRKQAMLDPEP